MYNTFVTAAILLIVAAILGCIIGWLLKSRQFGEKEAEVTAANDKLREAEAAFRKSESYVKDKDNQINSLMSKSGKVDSEISALKAQIAEAEKYSRTLKNDLLAKDRDLAQNLAQKDRELAQRDKEIAEMRETEVKFQELLAKFEHNTAIAKNLEAELGGIKSEKDDYRSKYDALVKETEAFRLDNADMVNKFTSVKSNLDAANAEIERLKKSVEKAQNASTDEVSRLKTQLTQFESQKAETQTEISGFRSQVSGFTSQIGGLEGEIAALNAKLAQAESQKADAQTEMLGFKSQVDNFGSQIGGLESEIAALNAKLAQAEADKKADLAQLEIDKQAADANANSFKTKWEELQIGNGRLLQDVETLKAKLNASSEASANNAALEGEISKLKAQLNLASEASSNNTALEGEISKLKADLNASSQACGEKCAALQAQIEELNQELIAAKEAAAAAPVAEISDEDLFAQVFEVETMPSAEEVQAAVQRVKSKASQIEINRIGEKDFMVSDDLKQIKGIGEFTEKKLHAAGINSFRQIANLNDSDEEVVEDAIEFFPGRVRRYDWVGQAKEILGIEQTKEEIELSRVKRKAGAIDFNIIGFATSRDKDDLKEIKGIGPFIEKKLNALGIYKFNQIGKFTENIDDIVNKAIEFFPGRIKRDDWKGQAKVLADAKKS